MAQSNWEADKMLNVYIHDYLLKRKLHNSAKAFMTEGKVATDPVAIDAPGGFLFEWWSVFWDIFIARTNEKHSEAAAAYIETQHMKAREHQQQQQLQMQQLQLMQQRNAQLQRRNPNHSPLGGPVTAINSEGMMGQPSASVLAMKMYEEQMKHPQPMDLETSSALIDPNRMALLKSSHQGQLVQGNLGNMLQQIQGRPQLATDIKGEVNLGGTQKSLPMDPSSIYGQAILQSKAGLGAGLNQGVTGLPLKGWPLTGIDEVRPSLGLQVQKPNLQTQNQFLLASQQQQVLAQAQGNLGNSPNYGFGGLPRGNFNVKDGQLPRNDGSICSPVQSNLPKMKLSQMQHSSSQQHDQLQQQQQQQQQTNRKRKQHSSSGHANSTGTSNTVGPSPSSPASTHTPGDGMTSMSKGLMMYGGEGTGGIASSTNQLDDLEPFGDIGSLEDNVESFLSHDGGDGNIYARLKQTLNEHKPESSKGFSFGEVGCIRTRNKVTCCHFSSDGKLLASAGHDKKAVLWNMDTLQTETTPEEHQYLITDIRFRPNSSQLATASFDKSVRLWDSTNPSYCLHAYTGHTSHVMSLDFHPKKNDLFCFCDSNNEIRYWSITPFSCTRVSKQGGSAQVRFQPLSGRLLAAASDKVVSVFDVENDRKIHSFQGHPGVVNYLCWDLNGELLASISEESVKVWSLTTGDCIHELSATGNQFHSCVFHPSYSALLVIGAMRSLELWDMVENKSMTVPAHENIIAALAQSPATGMVGSASHDSSVKLWK
ncbi:Transcriptional corepressor LEUNIG [Capsicum annuum]|uniref:transcriptional corepressor LEUNIG_HOMOLOG isoform X1 n=2 Tax=Capsicum annuum TaxID=4072 RepID=UPI001FB09327|nr:transcriptional corepressor LEUNIG_HOMOLOG isoform X1 [Capsicum annuum]XP_047252900.1 transcriptional corepressor LEUNIG_HOMOLOG isoform X1 [Capsicum annuum]KAF3627356.1 Transcriptional corepressor LEUNIG [Capsicum annuum]